MRNDYDLLRLAVRITLEGAPGGDSDLAAGRAIDPNIADAFSRHGMPP